MPAGCHNCKRPRSAATCAKCRVVDYDDISIASTPHAREEMAAVRAAQTPSQNATALPPEAESRIRQMLATVTALDPLSVLLLHFVANGGQIASFGRHLERTADSIRKYGAGMSRQTAHARWQSICAAFAPFAELYASSR